MSLQSPLARVRGLGSAKDGTNHWWAQRLTAVALVPLSLWFIYAVVALAGGDLAAYTRWVKAPGTVLLLVLFVAVLFYHLALGLQIVVEDYVHGEKKKVVSIVVIKFAAVLLAVSSIISVFQVAFGG
jgi:succinate dehydrogenase / fumarate reductase membrane anchor subunit